MKTQFFLTSAALLLTGCTNIEITSVEILPYKDGKDAAISFTFDDGMLCHYTDIAPQLERRGMRGTFWIIGDNMDKVEPNYPWMTWQQVAQLAKRGHEISNHSWHHPDLTKLSEDSLRWEIQYNDSVLQSVTGKRPRTFCYPYNAVNEEVIRVCSEDRVGTRTYQAAHGQDVSKQTADSLSQWLDNIISTHQWGVTMTHGTTYGWDYWHDPEVLYHFFDEVQEAQNRVWVGTFEEVAAYTEEVKDAEITDLHCGRVALFTPRLKNLSTDLFDQALTFRINGDFKQHEYRASQEGHYLVVDNRGDHLLINALPNGKKVEISIIEQPTDKVIFNGQPWQDTEGNHINAHGGNIIQHNGTWFWYGENRPDQGGTTEAGISVYSSPDLLHWTNRGIALAVNTEEGHDIQRGCIMERPKVIYNARTGKFVMLFHLELKGRGYEAARVAFAQSDSPAGPFTFIRSTRTNAGHWPENLSAEQIAKAQSFDLTKWGRESWWTPQWWQAAREGVYLYRDMEGGQMSRDMTLWVEEDGKAYQITSSEENLTLHINELTDDYLDFTGRYAVIAPGGMNEAPVLFRHGGKYWMICSGCTGWMPNEARMFSADNIWGPWTQHPSPFTNEQGLGYHNAGAHMTFHAQGTYCLKTPSGQYLFMADIWNPDHLRQSLHLWLPIHFDDSGTPVIPWEDAIQVK